MFYIKPHNDYFNGGNYLVVVTLIYITWIFFNSPCEEFKYNAVDSVF